MSREAKRSFTPTEPLAIIATIGILLAIPAPALSESHEAARQESREKRIPIGLDNIPRKGVAGDDQLAKELGLSLVCDMDQWRGDSPGNYRWKPRDAGSYPPGLDQKHLNELKKAGFKIAITFTNVNMDETHFPKYLKGKRLNDPYVLERLEAWLEAYLSRYGDQIDYLNIGNEVSTYNGNHPQEWPDCSTGQEVPFFSPTMATSCSDMLDSRSALLPRPARAGPRGNPGSDCPQRSIPEPTLRSQRGVSDRGHPTRPAMGQENLDKQIHSIRQVLRRQVGVDQGHPQFGMAEQLANDVEVATAHDQSRGEVVTEVMPAEISNGRFFQEFSPGGINVGEAATIT